MVVLSRSIYEFMILSIKLSGFFDINKKNSDGCKHNEGLSQSPMNWSSIHSWGQCVSTDEKGSGLECQKDLKLVCKFVFPVRKIQQIWSFPIFSQLLYRFASYEAISIYDPWSSTPKLCLCTKEKVPGIIFPKGGNQLRFSLFNILNL